MSRDGDAGWGVWRKRVWGMWNCAYGIRAMVKSNNLYAVYAACLMLHNSRQPRTHTRSNIYTDTSYPFRSREATSPRCPICMGNNFVWLPRRLLQLTVTSSVNRAQREIYTFFRILIKWHHLSQSTARSVRLSAELSWCLSPVCILQFFQSATRGTTHMKCAFL